MYQWYQWWYQCTLVTRLGLPQYHCPSNSVICRVVGKEDNAALVYMLAVAIEIMLCVVINQLFIDEIILCTSQWIMLLNATV